MRQTEELKQQARQEAREILSRSASFHQLPQQEQLAMYKDIVNASYNKLAGNGGGLSEELAKRFYGKPEKASDRIDDARHYNKRIEQAGDIAEEFIDAVNFPQFVADLLKGVFDANLNVTVKQMEEYVKLMKAATASVAKFVNAIDDTAAFGYLAENNSDDFGLDFSEDETDEDGTPKMVLTDKDGNKLDVSDNEVKAKIMEAKIAMAKEQRAILRETILMGVSRLVVEKGTVKAGVLFDIKAKEKINKADKAALKKQKSESSSSSSGGGLFGKIFGGSSGGSTTSKRKTEISVSSAKSVASTDLQAKLSGNVEIIFKSDYFKLDNFATMYGPANPQQLPAGPGGAAAAPSQKVS